MNSNINEVIKVISCLFHEKTLHARKSTNKHKKEASDFHSDVFTCIKSIKSKQMIFTQMLRTKKHKMYKKHKKHKNVKQATFFLDVFYANKKHENANERIGDFLHLTCFLSAFKNVFFVFVRL